MSNTQTACKTSCKAACKAKPLAEQLSAFEQEFPDGSEVERIHNIYNTCVQQTKKFVQDAGFQDVVIGLSGGIDSSLVAKIAVDALGSNHVYGVILPGPHSSESSVKDALQLAKALQIEVFEVPINEPFTAFKGAIEKGMAASLDLTETAQEAESCCVPCVKEGQQNLELSDLTLQNIQARSRMVVLMAASNQFGWILLNTANKSEVYTGYSTMYGDMAGSFAPIGDAYKTDVFKMCKLKNLEARQNGEVPPIPENVISKPPSAELTAGQTDEASLGIDYPTLDAILHEYVDNGRGQQELEDIGFDLGDVKTTWSKIESSDFKRPYEPPCAVIG